MANPLMAIEAPTAKAKRFKSFGMGLSRTPAPSPLVLWSFGQPLFGTWNSSGEEQVS